MSNSLHLDARVLATYVPAPKLRRALLRSAAVELAAVPPTHRAVAREQVRLFLAQMWALISGQEGGLRVA